ncbi:MAG: hypothetical protein J7J28_02240, partial [Thaumarchaeota archaeon]|nr:hypothetical protein [Nitrososphaerota archaeon]
MACEELLLDILTQSADSICAALATVRHLLHIRTASSLHLPLLLWCWRFDVRKQYKFANLKPPTPEEKREMQ